MVVYLYAPTHDTDFEPNNSIVPSPKMYFCLCAMAYLSSPAYALPDTKIDQDPGDGQCYC